MERALLTLGRSRRGLTQEQEAQPSRYSAHPHGPRHAPGSGTAPARLHHAPGPSQPSKREVLVPSVFPPSRKLTLSVTRGSEDHGRTGASMHLPSDSSPFIDWLLSPSPERRLQGHASRTQPRWTPPESSPPKTPSPQVKWGGPVHAPGGLRHFLAPLPLQDERCSRPPRAGPHLLPACPAPPYPPPPPAPLQAGPLVGPSLTFVRALLSPHKALFYPTNSCSSFRALREVPFSAKRPLTLDEPPGHPRQLVR